MKKYLYYEKKENENKAEVTVISNTLILGLENYIEYNGDLEEDKALYIDLENNKLIFEDVKPDKMAELTQQVKTLKEVIDTIIMEA